MLFHGTEACVSSSSRILWAVACQRHQIHKKEKWLRGMSCSPCSKLYLKVLLSDILILGSTQAVVASSRQTTKNKRRE